MGGGGGERAEQAWARRALIPSKRGMYIANNNMLRIKDLK